LFNLFFCLLNLTNFAICVKAVACRFWARVLKIVRHDSRLDDFSFVNYFHRRNTPLFMMLARLLTNAVLVLRCFWARLNQGVKNRFRNSE
jgi:hypothetical protein